ncbi:ATP-binding cassette domain-containing protein [Streptomyces sp. SID4919]|uniref:ABC transporter ATP-binding protein n=1 Tax=unclassified Streptomyces TaxID=2593676 RepID=UPI000823C24F|nr:MULTISPECIES: ATP-binding cassette domain-containing protein [unclassified Streptomyces]MYY13401.1 ATP-binding cassette domain-containing protein [Streptomyces sp. SID4919]SCK61244.1 ABC-2 type transport system ATP-binding protein [Streptomyces sp. AmelKG-E11A]
MIEVDDVTKRYGRTTAVHGLSFTVAPGQVTGFLGPNGAGKSTTLRMVLGLTSPTSGTVTVGGRRFRGLPRGLCEVGALLDAGDAHGGRTARAHLAALARGNGLPRRRVDEVLAQTGLTSVAGRRVGGFSLGMRQRLGIAGALLGDPPVLLFDEPLNGLDPEGIRWVRGLFRRLADEGRTVLVSSHLMREMEHTAQRLIVIGRGELIATGTLAEFAAADTTTDVSVRTPDPAALATALVGPGVEVRVEGDGSCAVTGLTAERIGDLALLHRIPLHGLTPRRASLEETFMGLTSDSVEYGSGNAR